MPHCEQVDKIGHHLVQLRAGEINAQRPAARERNRIDAAIAPVKSLKTQLKAIAQSGDLVTLRSVRRQR
ncbi:hypothetical protein AADZ90_007320 [Aestuariibius sp. 2305UL40-4]|uniref:hypothetical protein n=1 Tax=Aestuariibius violaceus TaxID=3234132 RepID=UPI00345E8790